MVTAMAWDNARAFNEWMEIVRILRQSHSNAPGVMITFVDTHGQSPWHFTGQAKLDLNPDPPAISHTQ